MTPRPSRSKGQRRKYPRLNKKKGNAKGFADGNAAKRRGPGTKLPAEARGHAQRKSPPPAVKGFKQGLSLDSKTVLFRVLREDNSWLQQKKLNDVSELCRKHTRRNFAAIMLIAHDHGTPAGIRLAALIWMQEQAWGKVPQRQIHSNPDGSPVNFGGLTDDQLAADIARLRELEQRQIDARPVGGHSLVSDQAGGGTPEEAPPADTDGGDRS